ncbi:2-C-methyl-D-erythritol 4-phosphate cytidylyltransferase [Undibacterium sp. FT147W]|uniref:2-C-methyl-D-erythritol 4-phosphate cytidylyltransferase n=1 Tax=Undibacterium rivi TaxID=2828729 RepID=A0ABS5H023_9BURK|nr:2-C-methyl-D-erythritol 4-phosphate cytidylyltransferase [Undibacterium rivi]MBR7792055.1 2-C-methyl-D-erythritol 4-phosphate cytidylyltransferase [Undibacterium rivi]
MSEELIQQQGQSPRYVALIPAAGVGARMGANSPKQYLTIAGKSILQHTVNAFLNFPGISHTYVVVSEDDAVADTSLLAAERMTILRCGGATRRDSVRNGLAYLADKLDANDWVLVHDAARPGLTSALLQKLIDQVGSDAVGGLLALPVVDTVKRIQDGKVETVSREGLWLAQTPQMFRYALLCKALDQAEQVTDESSALELMGYSPVLVEGHACNLKVTLPADLMMAAQYLQRNK